MNNLRANTCMKAMCMENYGDHNPISESIICFCFQRDKWHWSSQNENYKNASCLPTILYKNDGIIWFEINLFV